MRSRSVKHLISHTTVATCSLIIAIIAIGILWWDTAHQPALPSSFSYSADTVTSEVYFTSPANKPQPSLYTQTNFAQSLTQINNQPALRTTIGTLSHNADRHITYSSSAPVDTTEGTYATATGAPQYVMAPRSRPTPQHTNNAMISTSIPRFLRDLPSDSSAITPPTVVNFTLVYTTAEIPATLHRLQ